MDARHWGLILTLAGFTAWVTSICGLILVSVAASTYRRTASAAASLTAMAGLLALAYLLGANW